MRIQCKCGQGCEYQASTYEVVNKLSCNNSRMERYNAMEKLQEIRAKQSEEERKERTITSEI